MEGVAQRAIALLRQAMGAGLLLLVGLTLMQVGLRYLLHHSIDWVEEISVVVLTWLAWVGATLLWLQRRHPAVDLAIGALSPTGRLQLYRLFDVAAIVLGIGLAISTRGTIAMFDGIELAGLGIDSAVKYQPVLAGGVGLAFAGAINLLR
ncbi:MAG: TRAP transporter small permease subunit [Reyranellaceae bacterium]